MKFIGKDLPVIPSLHDLNVKKITFEDNKMTFIFRDIAEYDSIIYQDIKANELDLVIEIFDYDFCHVSICDFADLNYDDDEEDFSKEVKTSIYSLKEFIKIIQNDDFYMYILDMVTSYNKVIIQTDTMLGSCQIELSIKTLDFQWK